MNLIILPIWIPVMMIIIHLIVRRERIASILAISGSLLLLISAVILAGMVSGGEILTLVVGGWDAPFGISMVIDPMSALFLVVSSVIIVSISLFARRVQKKENLPRFYIFFFTLVLGINGAFITGDIFNLYVWFEIMLLSSFVLITLGFSKQQMRAGIKYMALNLIGSLFFLAGIGLLYGKTGTLNMAHLAQILMNDDQSILINSSAMLFFLAFGIKAAVFPLYFWLPSAYHTPDISVTSLFAGILTKVGVYAMIRFFTLFFVQDPLFWHNLLFIIAGFTMIVGGMAATSRYEIRKVAGFQPVQMQG